MELGPKQKEWLASLRANPDRQMTGKLGLKKADGTYRACCLGELGLICGVLTWKGDVLKDEGLELISTNYLSASYITVGLISSYGKNVNGGESLAVLNDSGKTWPQIANIVEANPANYFTKSI